jgi:hypothetical protein
VDFGRRGIHISIVGDLHDLGNRGQVLRRAISCADYSTDARVVKSEVLPDRTHCEAATGEEIGDRAVSFQPINLVTRRQARVYQRLRIPSCI